VLATIAVGFCCGNTVAKAEEASPLQLETKIPLGDVKGRIDHMAVDPARHRLLVAALGNGTLEVIDLEAKRVDHSVAGLREPQGVGYDAANDTIYVASAGDGSLKLFNGSDLKPKARVDLGSDADNIRVDSKSGRVFVGHGAGALAIIDAATRSRIADVPLDAHPESFQLDAATDRIFVNLPNVRAIDVIDRAGAKKIGSWSTAGRSANFAMALDQRRQRLLVAFRRPAELGVYALDDGKPVASVPTCGDIDDLFVDAKRDRVYVSCGEGFLDVLTVEGDSYLRVAHIATAAGARTSLFVPDLDRLLLAVPARAETSAAIWVFRPVP
jgi:DNA-binding beta-propeller fold protein YncE